MLIRAEIDRIETDYGLDVKLDWKKINILKTSVDKSIEIRRQRWIFIGNQSANHEYTKKLFCKFDVKGYSIDEVASAMGQAYHFLSVYLKNTALEPGMGEHDYYHLTQSIIVNDILSEILKDFDFKVGTFE